MDYCKFCRNKDIKCGTCLMNTSDGRIPSEFIVAESAMSIPRPNDVVNHPNHYTSGKIECIDALESATANLTGIEAVCTANAIKYLWRWKQKNGIEDLNKAKWYLEKLISTQEVSNA